jgi:hypothetical protein
MFKTTWLSLTIILFFINFANAQYGYDNRLKFEIKPYVWMTSMNGDATVRGVTQPINFTLEDYYKSSNLGLNGKIELRKKNFGILIDWNNVDLHKEKSFIDLSVLEVSLIYRVYKNLEILAGGRYIRSKIGYPGIAGQNVEGNEKWIDPIIGGRISWEISKRFIFLARADIGGFGAGSDFEWNLMGGVGYRLANITFLVSYRLWNARYENGTNENQFIYDITTSGPDLGMVLKF